ncbi:hypothetical protein [Demequina subtropica]|uniref:hypothetical protein n=1 Tax=Demequina subtropica TaxID=1638989 RepID=UPI0012E01D60|nr:hypothetical protein [Demequina subtropica]
MTEFNRTYSYDMAGRLIEVTDRTATLGEVLNTDASAGDVTPCVTRSYAFDVRGNRLSRTTGVSDADGVCVTAGAGASESWTYDSADRVQTGANATGAYVYDPLGGAAPGVGDDDKPGQIEVASPAHLPRGSRVPRRSCVECGPVASGSPLCSADVELSRARRRSSARATVPWEIAPPAVGNGHPTLGVTPGTTIVRTSHH